MRAFGLREACRWRASSRASSHSKLDSTDALPAPPWLAPRPLAPWVHAASAGAPCDPSARAHEGHGHDDHEGMSMGREASAGWSSERKAAAPRASSIWIPLPGESDDEGRFTELKRRVEALCGVGPSVRGDGRFLQLYIHCEAQEAQLPQPLERCAPRARRFANATSWASGSCGKWTPRPWRSMDRGLWSLPFPNPRRGRHVRSRTSQFSVLRPSS